MGRCPCHLSMACACCLRTRAMRLRVLTKSENFAYAAWIGVRCRSRGHVLFYHPGFLCSVLKGAATPLPCVPLKRMSCIKLVSSQEHSRRFCRSSWSVDCMCR